MTSSSTPQKAADIPRLTALLTSVGLPSEDVRHGEQDYLLAFRGGVLVGSVGLEKHGKVALLRSLAVAPELRRHGLGGQLYDRILAQALASGAHEAYVLTTTAERFCAARGFARVDRSSVPEAIRHDGRVPLALPHVGRLHAAGAHRMKCLDSSTSRGASGRPCARGPRALRCAGRPACARSVMAALRRRALIGSLAVLSAVASLTCSGSGRRWVATSGRRPWRRRRRGRSGGARCRAERARRGLAPVPARRPR